MNLLLRILSWLYGFFVGLRNLLYDEHVLHSFQPALPTICVGNLAVGGTGKTPHVEYLAGMLQNEGYRVAVLSRGYKRRTHGFLEADEHSTAAQIGDEASGLKQKHPELIVAVCEDRLIGILRLKRRHPDLQLVLLDDVFQHRRLRAGYNILLTQADRLYVEDSLLPLGRLREHARGSYRADMVVVTKCPPHIQPIEQRLIDTKLNLPPYKPLIFTRMRYLDPIPVFNSPKVPRNDVMTSYRNNGIPGSRVLLLTGIAQPQYLRDYVQSLGAEVTPLTFPDHHAFTEADVLNIERVFREQNCSLILTTEKDAVRLRECANIPKQLIPFFFAQPIQVEFLGKDEQTFNNTILSYVRKSTTNR